MTVRLLVCAALTAGALAATGGTAWGSTDTSDEASAHLGPSNMGVCSPFLAGLPAPTGTGNVRALVNHLVMTGAFGVDTPGELYRVRAQQHLNQAPHLECLPRR